MIDVLYRSAKGDIRLDLGPGDVAPLLADQHGLVWINMVQEPDESAAHVLHDIFNFHPLAIDDALTESHIPKIDDWVEYVYVVLHAVLYDGSEDNRIATRELDAFLGENYLVTYQAQPIDSVQRVWDFFERGERHLERGTGYILYLIADEIATDYMPVIERIDVTIDRLEDMLFGSPRAAFLEELFALKRAVLHMRRIIAPQREVLNKLARGDFDVVDEAERVYFRDVYDHFVRLHEVAEGVRDLVTGALETYLSVVNNRMNEVMKVLTIITTLFMPITFLTGFFGMNFFEPVANLYAWTTRPALVAVMLVMLITPLTMFFWMRSRRWL